MENLLSTSKSFLPDIDEGELKTKNLVLTSLFDTARIISKLRQLWIKSSVNSNDRLELGKYIMAISNHPLSSESKTSQIKLPTAMDIKSVTGRDFSLHLVAYSEYNLIQQTILK